MIRYKGFIFVQSLTSFLMIVGLISIFAPIFTGYFHAQEDVYRQIHVIKTLRKEWHSQRIEGKPFSNKEFMAPFFMKLEQVHEEGQVDLCITYESSRGTKEVVCTRDL